DTVRLSPNFASPSATASKTGSQTVAVAVGKVVELAADYGTVRYTTSSGIRIVAFGDVVVVESGYERGGEWGVAYRYRGANGRYDLTMQNYADLARWVPIGGDAGSIYRYVGTPGVLDLNSLDYSDVDSWALIAGQAGGLYQWMGADGTTVNLASADFTDLGYWKPVGPSNYFPLGFNISTSPSVAVAAVVVLNDLRSDVRARIGFADLNADNLTVRAVQDSIVRADIDVTANSSGGSSFTGNGTSLAAAGIIATNRVLGSVNAGIWSSRVDLTGALVVEALITADIDATVAAAVSTGAEAWGLTLAFNTIGWLPTNTFFAFIDAVIGDPLIASNTAFGGQSPQQANALVQLSQIVHASSVTVHAESANSVVATVTNDATSAPAALFGAGGLSVNGVVVSNKVNGGARSLLDGEPTPNYALGVATATLETGDLVAAPGGGVYEFIGAPRGPPATNLATENYAITTQWRRVDGLVKSASAGAVSVTASSAGRVEATSTLSAVVAPNNDAGAGILNRWTAQVLDGYEFTSRSGTRTLAFGDRVRVADDFSGTSIVDGSVDPAGQVFQWMGLD
ncbi:hypothetical protein, partial [Flavobacterium sp.]|uniref:hypothetical protein n=1 Tax=Flavobacterium sp. TaxID=239 RepID=UPI003C3D47B3